MAIAKKKEIVCFGEVLWDVVEAKELPGGAPMNVAYHLTTLGHGVALISRIGNDRRGKSLLDFLVNKGVDVDFIQTDHTKCTSVVLANPDEDGNMVYEIVEDVAWDFIESLSNHNKVMEDAQYFVFGSLANRHSVSRNTLFQLMEYPAKKVMDINLREPFVDKKILEHQMKKADILKMNEEELTLVSDWYSSFSNMEDRMVFLQDRFDIQTTIVTRGSKGAIVCHENKFSENSGFKVNVADTIGSGDSFLAGFLSKRIANESVEQSLSFACALGGYVASKEGGCPPYTIDDLENLLNSKNL